jgi:nucleoside-diphosphate-sugar epimerase
MLVTGADGFTGQHFVPKAQAAGYEVFALHANLTDLASIQSEVLQIKPEMVVHLAAISFVAYADQAAIYDVNVIGTTNLLDALTKLDSPLQKVLLASSANVYGNSEDSPISEAQPPSPINHYAMSKLAMEYMARNYLGRLPIFFTRPFNYIGRGQSASFVIPKLVDHFKRRAPVIELGNIDVEREFNDVSYVCEAYLRLLQKASIGEVYNICSGEPVSLKLIIELLSEITGHSLEVRVNQQFVRANEIKRLCGEPKKLLQAMGEIPRLSLKEILSNMLEDGA